jgi:hypothetical protein
VRVDLENVSNGFLRSWLFGLWALGVVEPKKWLKRPDCTPIYCTEYGVTNHP